MLDQVMVGLIAQTQSTEENVQKPIEPEVDILTQSSEYLPFPDAGIDFEVVDEMFKDEKALFEAC